MRGCVRVDVGVVLGRVCGGVGWWCGGAGRHAYSIDYSTDSVTAVAVVAGEGAGAEETAVFVDRRRHKEERERLVEVGQETQACVADASGADTGANAGASGASSASRVSVVGCVLAGRVWRG